MNQPMKRCPQCQNLLHHSATQCPGCHYVYGTDPPASPPGSSPPGSYKICPNCQQPAVLPMLLCGRCGYTFPTPVQVVVVNQAPPDQYAWARAHPREALIGAVITAFLCLLYFAYIDGSVFGYHSNLHLVNAQSMGDSIVGTIHNDSNRTIGYAQVEINLYDAYGNQIGSTLANVTNLEPGADWQFTAPILYENTARFKVVHIRGW